jgi:tetratricopeptide (TPR) repeat protein
LNGDYFDANLSIDKSIDKWPAAHYKGIKAYINASTHMAQFNPQNIKGAKHNNLLISALNDYTEAIALNTQDDVLWHNRGWIRFHLGYPKQMVLSDFFRAIEIDGGSVVYRISLGMIYEQDGFNDLASIQYSTALEVVPSIIDSQFVRDLKQRSPELWNEVLKSAYEKLMIEYEKSSNIIKLAHISRLQMEFDDNEIAMENLLKITKVLPQLYRPWAYLGQLYLKNNDLNNAIACFKKALFLAHNDPVVIGVVNQVKSVDI